MALQILELRQGDSFDQVCTYKDDAGDPVNLTGYTFEFYLSFNGGHTYTSGPEVQNSGTPTDGKIILHLSPAETTLFTAIHGFWYLRLTDGSGDKTTLLRGDVYVDR